MDSEQNKNRSSYKSLTNESFIHEDTAPLPIRILKKVDIFSFIPVPKDDPVSTRQSLIGTALFFAIFLTYIIFDFYKFVTSNPPNAQNYYTKLDDEEKILPRFAITFMDGQMLNQTQEWNRYYNFKLTQQSKDKGSQQKPQVQMNVYKFFQQNQTINKDSIDWLDTDTKQFYSVLRTPSQPMKAKGLLYSTNNATYSKVKIQMCDINNNPQACEAKQTIEKKCAQGRIFLFIENILDTTDFSSAQSGNQNKYLIYNFFMIPYVYKRIIFNFQVVKTVVLPDYFYRFSNQQQTRLVIESYIQQTSDVTRNAKEGVVDLNLLGIQYQLSPQVLNVRVAYSTLIDHVSMWGAFWGVLFAIFAIIFLTYNKKKFYKKNPEWDKFKQNNVNFNDEEHDVKYT